MSHSFGNVVITLHELIVHKHVLIDDNIDTTLAKVIMLIEQDHLHNEYNDQFIGNSNNDSAIKLSRSTEYHRFQRNDDGLWCIPWTMSHEFSFHALKEWRVSFEIHFARLVASSESTPWHTSKSIVVGTCLQGLEYEFDVIAERSRQSIPLHQHPSQDNQSMGKIFVTLHFAPNHQSFHALAIQSLAKIMPGRLRSDGEGENNDVISESIDELLSLLESEDSQGLQEQDRMALLADVRIFEQLANTKAMSAKLLSFQSEVQSKKLKALFGSKISRPTTTQSKMITTPASVPWYQVSAMTKSFLLSLGLTLPHAPELSIGVMEKLMTLFVDASTRCQTTRVGGSSSVEVSTLDPTGEVSWAAFVSFIIAIVAWSLQHSYMASFLVAATECIPEELYAIRTLFSQYDADLAGQMFSSDVQLLLLDLGEKYNHVEMNVILSDLDPEGCGCIDFLDFMIWWTELPPSSSAADLVTAALIEARAAINISRPVVKIEPSLVMPPVNALREVGQLQATSRAQPIQDPKLFADVDDFGRNLESPVSFQDSGSLTSNYSTIVDSIGHNDQLPSNGVLPSSESNINKIVDTDVDILPSKGAFVTIANQEIVDRDELKEICNETGELSLLLPKSNAMPLEGTISSAIRLTGFSPLDILNQQVPVSSTIDRNESHDIQVVHSTEPLQELPAPFAANTPIEDSVLPPPKPSILAEIEAYSCVEDINEIPPIIASKASTLLPLNLENGISGSNDVNNFEGTIEPAYTDCLPDGQLADNANCQEVDPSYHHSNHGGHSNNQDEFNYYDEYNADESNDPNWHYNYETEEWYYVYPTSENAEYWPADYTEPDNNGFDETYDPSNVTNDEYPNEDLKTTPTHSSNLESVQRFYDSVLRSVALEGSVYSDSSNCSHRGPKTEPIVRPASGDENEDSAEIDDDGTGDGYFGVLDEDGDSVGTGSEVVPSLTIPGQLYSGIVIPAEAVQVLSPDGNRRNRRIAAIVGRPFRATSHERSPVDIDDEDEDESDDEDSDTDSNDDSCEDSDEDSRERSSATSSPTEAILLDNCDESSAGAGSLGVPVSNYLYSNPSSLIL